jgi:hypothetical protein
MLESSRIHGLSEAKVIMKFLTACLVFALPGVLASSPQRAISQPTGPSLDRPCSFVTAERMSTLLGVRVGAATDEHFRCRYAVGTGWLETKMLDGSLKIARDTFDYDKAHGKAVPGVADQAYVLGATLVARLGDVLVVVDASNVPRAPDNAKLKAIALEIVRQIP